MDERSGIGAKDESSVSIAAEKDIDVDRSGVIAQ